MAFSPPPAAPLFPCGERDGGVNGRSLWFDDLSGGEEGYAKNGRREGKNEGLEDEIGHSKLCTRGHWRPAEDSRLRDLVAEFGPQNWNLIAEKLEGRSGKSCRLRWFNQLDPRINKKAFSEEEEERLLSAHRLYGNKWALIARIFPGRTDNAVKNHWHVIMARRQRNQQPNACGRRKTLHSSPKPLDKSSNNASSVESTVSSNRDEPFSRFQAHGFLTRYRSLPIGTDGNALGSSVAIPGQGADHSVFSGSNSEASATESVVNNGFLPEKDDKHERRDKISLPFIDFMGVGAI